MKAKYIAIIALIVVTAFAAKGYFNKGCRTGVCSIFSANEANAALLDNDLPTGTEQITFVELGSKNCIPCKQMQPIMDEIKEEYAGKVKVVFHDVWTSEGKKYGSEYGIRLIPTQVFLDKKGNEIARHEGFFPKEGIVKIFEENGVTK